MSKEDSILYSRISRRRLLQGGALAASTAFLAACGAETPEPTPTPRPSSTIARPTPRPSPTRIPTREVPTPTPIPEPLVLKESIDVGIPGLVVERYNSRIRDVTSSIPADTGESIEKMFAEVDRSWPEFVRKNSFMLVAEPSAEFFNTKLGDIYYNGFTHRYFSGIKDGEKEAFKNTSITLGYIGISSDGKLLSSRFLQYPRADNRQSGTEYILDDTTALTKTVIRDALRKNTLPPKNGESSPYITPAPDFEVNLLSNGSKLLVSFFEDRNRGTYLVDLKSWKAQPLNINNKVVETFIDNSIFSGDRNFVAGNKHLVPNSDGSLIYAPFIGLVNGSARGAVIDTRTGRQTYINWPDDQRTAPPNRVSDNMMHIAQSSTRGTWLHEDGMFETLVKNPNGIFRIDSSRNITPMRIYNNGNLFVSGHGEQALFVPRNGRLELAATKDGKDFPHTVERIG